MASGSPNGVSSDVWCGMLGWDAVTLSIGRPERWLLPKRWDLVGVFWTSSAGRAENYLSWAGAGDVLGGGAESCCGLGLPGHGSMTLWWCVTQAHNLYSFCSTAVVFGGDRISTVRSPTFL